LVSLVSGAKPAHAAVSQGCFAMDGAGSKELVEWGAGEIALGCSGPRGAFGAAGWLARVGIEDHGQPGNGAFVEFPFAAHITDPGREVWHHDQFLSQPGEIGNMA
jgi:hypothetical protein